MRSFKNDRENWSGQNRTSRTACYGHAFEPTVFQHDSFMVLTQIYASIILSRPSGSFTDLDLQINQAFQVVFLEQ